MTSKLMQVVLALNPGGTERLVLELTRAARARHEVSVCCLDSPGAWSAGLEAEGIEVFSLDRAPGFHPSLGWRLARAASARGVKVLHCHQYSPYVYACLARLARPDLRIIFTEHGRNSDEPPSSKRRLATPLLSLAASASFAVSEDLRQYMISAGFSARRLQVIPNGIDVGPVPTVADRAAARAALGIAQEALVIGTVGRLSAVKDFPMLVDAFGRLLDRFPNACLVVIGEGPDRARVEMVVGQLTDPSRVKLAGHREDVRSLLPAFDVFANTSVSEGISLTVLEAMSACLPIVATAVGGTPEVVVNGATGRLVPARDPVRCAAALGELLHSAEERDRLGAAGRARVESLFTIERMTAQYMALYDRLAAS